MKKVIAVLLAVMMLFSVVAIGVAAEAEVEGDTTTTTAPADGEGTKTELPDWLTNLIARLKVVLAKLLFKLGLKVSWATAIAA